MERKKYFRAILIVTTVAALLLVCVFFLVNAIWQIPEKSTNERGGITYSDRIHNKSPTNIFFLTLPKQFPKDAIPVLGKGQVRGYMVSYNKSNTIYNATLNVRSKNSAAECAEECEAYFSGYTVIEKEVKQNQYVDEAVHYSYKLQNKEYRYTIYISKNPGDKWCKIEIRMYHNDNEN